MYYIIRMSIHAALILVLFICWQGASAAILPADGSRPAAERKAFSGGYEGYNVILISITGLGANRMSLYGYGRATTPNLDAWAKQRIVFDDAFTHASWTLPAAVSLLTSMHPYSHRIWRRNFSNSLSTSVLTLPEILGDNGYATAAFTGGLDYHPAFSQMRGFRFAAEKPNYSGFDATLPQAEAWLAKHSGEKFFLLIQGYSLHCPFNPPEPYKGTFGSSKTKPHQVDHTRCVRGFNNGDGVYKAFYSGGCWDFSIMRSSCNQERNEVTLTQDDIDYLGDLYDDSVLRVDDLVGNFLASLKRDVLDRTIIVVTADHGEMFAKHGRFGRAGTHRGTHYNDVLHIPLIVHLPEAPPRRVGGMVQYIDIMPTILDALGLPAPRTAQGLSLKPLIEAGTAVNAYVYSGLPYNLNPAVPGREQSSRPRNATDTISDGRWKLIHETFDRTESLDAGGGEILELYDVTRDPEELRNLSKEEPEKVEELWSRLRAWILKSRNAAPASSTTQQVPSRLLKDARERGYWP